MTIVKFMKMDFLEKNKDITSLSNFKTKAKTKYYFEIQDRQSIDKIIQIIEFSKKEKLEVLFIWWGTNILFAFDFFDWIIIKNCLEWWSYDKETCFLEAYSWASIWDISLCLEQNYNQELWHRFIWLPWSIGWAVFWNAGCFGLEIANNFVEAEVLNLKTWQIEILWKKDMEFEYRNSKVKRLQTLFIIKVKFDLSKKIEKYSVATDNIYFREHCQPKWNTCWSFFKNPGNKKSAWSLIEEVWLKGYREGTAYFSSLHANFLMSDEWWDYRDLLKLIELAKKKVLQIKKINIIPEVRILFNKK